MMGKPRCLGLQSHWTKSAIGNITKAKNEMQRATSNRMLALKEKWTNQIGRKSGRNEEDLVGKVPFK